MTAPGNATVLIVLLAVLVACTGYAAGRLHQWHRSGLDRDEAYRDGYDTAARSTFSLAARIVGLRRDRGRVRATAPVPARCAPEGPAPASPSPASAHPPASAPSLDAHARPLSRAGSRFRRLAPPRPASSVPPIVSAPASAPDSATDAPASTSEPSGPGRHVVPDELVHAPTYRLAPDRVARAKVRRSEPR